MGKEAGHSMEPILRHSHVLGELLKSFLLQIAELLLNPVQGGHEHRRIQRQPFYSHLLIKRRIQCQSTVGWCNCFLRDLRSEKSPSRLRVGRRLTHRIRITKFGRLYCVALVTRKAARCSANALASKLTGEETSSRIRPNSAEATGG